MDAQARRVGLRDRVRGCLQGGAIGDALGGPVEFDDLATIRRRHPGGVDLDEPGLITDDTQMTLFTADGLIRGLLHGDPVARLWEAYQRWLLTQGAVDPFPETNDWLLGHRRLWAARAPGATCVGALRNGRPGRTDAPVNSSKGCGGVMRAAPAGFLTERRDAYRTGCELSALTHGHPTGWIAGGALALLVHLLAVADQPLTVALLETERVVAAEPDGSEVRDALAAAVDAARRAPADATVLATLGEGWVAEEALAIGVYAALSCQEASVPAAGSVTGTWQGADSAVSSAVAAALRLAVEHSGDSDSTGAIAGNLLGAMWGTGALPADWLTRVELAELIGTVADDLVDAVAGETGRLVDRYP
ncbi:MAG: ADP-ribosylglycohydrolase family protein [Micromonosporaceae bacterium]